MKCIEPADQLVKLGYGFEWNFSDRNACKSRAHTQKVWPHPRPEKKKKFKIFNTRYSDSFWKMPCIPP